MRNISISVLNDRKKLKAFRNSNKLLGAESGEEYTIVNDCGEEFEWLDGHTAVVYADHVNLRTKKIKYPEECSVPRCIDYIATPSKVDSIINVYGDADDNLLHFNCSHVKNKVHIKCGRSVSLESSPYYASDGTRHEMKYKVENTSDTAIFVACSNQVSAKTNGKVIKDSLYYDVVCSENSVDELIDVLHNMAKYPFEEKVDEKIRRCKGLVVRFSHFGKEDASIIMDVYDSKYGSDEVVKELKIPYQLGEIYKFLNKYEKYVRFGYETGIYHGKGIKGTNKDDWYYED